MTRMWLASLLALLLWTRTACALEGPSTAAAAETESRRLLAAAVATAKPYTFQGFDVSQTTGESCVLALFKNVALKCPNEADKLPGYASVHGQVLKFAASANWRLECSKWCAQARLNGLPCFSFIYRGPKTFVKKDRNSCVFRTCDMGLGSAKNSAKRAANKKKLVLDKKRGVLVKYRKVANAVQTAVMLNSDCTNTWTPTSAPATSAPSAAPATSAPSARPHTSKPTKRPTPVPTRKSTRSPTVPTLNPTYAPVAGRRQPIPTRLPTRDPTIRITLSPTHTKAPTSRPTKSPNMDFRSPSNIPDSYPVDMSLFRRIVPDTSLCKIVRPAIASNFIRYNNFRGTQQQCVRECQYDGGCNGAMFSRVAQVCMKLVKPETVDQKDEISNYVREEWVAFAKTHFVVPYFNNFCGTYGNRANCNLIPECEWNNGEKGWNQIKQTDRGYCGRMKCPL